MIFLMILIMILLMILLMIFLMILILILLMIFLMILIMILLMIFLMIFTVTCWGSCWWSCWWYCWWYCWCSWRDCCRPTSRTGRTIRCSRPWIKHTEVYNTKIPFFQEKISSTDRRYPEIKVVIFPFIISV